MKKAFVSLCILVLGVGLIGFFIKGKPSPEAIQPPAPEPPRVSTIAVQPRDRAVPVISQGIVKARREIDLVAEVGGRVISTAEDYAIGGVFEKGDVLLQIDPDQYELAVVRAASRVAEAEERLATERGRAIQAKREWRDLGNSSANELFLRKPQIASAEAQVKAAKAELRIARRDLAKTKLAAPFDGRIREVKADLGQFLNVGAQIAKVYATSTAQIRLPLTDRQLESLPWTDQQQRIPVEISAVVAGEEHVWQAHIERLDGVIDERTRLSYAIVEVPEPFDTSDGKVPLRIGQFVSASIAGEQIANVLEVPSKAIRENNTLWTAEQQRLKITPVRVLYEAGRTALVQWQNDEAQQVITGTIGSPQEGMKISPQIKQATAASGKRP